MLVFVTITIPVQLSGNWITLLWTGEALLLFWIGRKKQFPIYEFLSYPLILLSFISLSYDWIYLRNHEVIPVFNVHCLTSVLFIAAFSWITILNRKNAAPVSVHLDFYKILSYIIPIILIFTAYTTFRLEIFHYYDQQIIRSNSPIINFRTIWILNYSLFFVSALSFVNLKKIKNQVLGQVGIGLNMLTVLVFLIQGLIILGNLRYDYFNPSITTSALNIVIRYISFIFVAITLYATFLYTKTSFLQKKFKTVFDIFLYLSILWIASSEFIHWTDMARSTEGYKIGLSILWGCFALLLIILGIWKKKKHLRIAAMVLFGITLIKLFAYDITHVGTIGKTIVFVSLGVIVLIISFLYNKYKRYISEENAE
jgi:hypothetical protein